MAASTSGPPGIFIALAENDAIKQLAGWLIRANTDQSVHPCAGLGGDFRKQSSKLLSPLDLDDDVANSVFHEAGQIQARGQTVDKGPEAAPSNEPEACATVSDSPLRMLSVL
jgi:hypothetical protein